MRRKRSRGPKPPAPYRNANPNERGVLVIFERREESRPADAGARDRRRRTAAD